MRVAWKKWALGAAIVVGLIVIVALIAQATPGALQVEPDARQISGNDTNGLGPRIPEFRAAYRRWSRVLGLPVDSSTGVVSARRIEPDTIDVTFELSGFGIDLMRLDDDNLVLVSRAFGEPGGPGQSFARRGNALDATVRAADGSVRELTFDYPVPVFEPSLLELPLGLLGLAEGDRGHLAWSNFGDATDFWLPFDVRGSATVQAAGRTFETRIVRVRFPNGVQRDYWLSPEPPYKVRLVVYERGRLVTSGWELEALEIFD